jgi:hypothetical protein
VTIGEETVVQARAENLESEIQSERVLLQLNTGIYYGLNKIGSVVWELLRQPISVKDIVNRLEAHYAVERALLVQDVTKLVESLLAAELARVVRCG